MTKVFFICLLLAAKISGYSQQPDSVQAGDLYCEIQAPRKTLSDWADLSRYKLDDDALAPPAPGVKRVVFFGSSTTDNWGRKFDSIFFPEKSYINRGISGETSAQMLLRFQQDIVALKPSAVVF
jgi:hypothetical protein